MDKKIDLTKITHNAYVDEYFNNHGIRCSVAQSRCDKACIFNLTRDEKLKLNHNDYDDVDVQCFELKYTRIIYHCVFEMVPNGDVKFMIKYPNNVPTWALEAMKRYINDHPEDKL